ncbi:flagellar biosynthetic protein FliR [Roseomonas sp. 18066]|uniref:flagellar biosynthetic protein FliR n=1 Tax=Roseomonas sp. 18066 TaxID=2681412 RepID=UPI0013580B37|nr:flagellar biosynthetic protein FliR [Roseomonas sp. 18066]
MQASLALEPWLSAELYRWFLVFCRAAAALMLLPGFGETQLPGRIRVIAALVVAFCLAPLAGPLQPVPGALGMAGAIAVEVLAGSFLGALSRLLLSAVHVAGQIIGQSIGLSNAFAFGIGADNAAILGSVLYAAVMAAFFAMDGHHAGLRAILDSYRLVPLGEAPAAAPAARALTEALATAFRLAMQLSMPFLILSVVFNAALAGINRALPAMPVFMIGAPAILMTGLYLLGVAAPTLLSEVLGAYAGAFVLSR